MDKRCDTNPTLHNKKGKERNLAKKSDDQISLNFIVSMAVCYCCEDIGRCYSYYDYCWD